MATVNLGRIKPVFRGAYNNSTAYVIDDIVTSGGETFIAIAATQGNATSDASKWTKLAAKGADGADGTDVAATLANKEISFKTNAGALDGIPIGNAGEFLKVNSGATGYEFGAVSSDYVLLGTTTPTSFASSFSIDGYFSATYDNYKIIINDFLIDNMSSYHVKMRPNTGGSANTSSVNNVGWVRSDLSSGGGNLSAQSYGWNQNRVIFNYGSTTQAWSGAAEINIYNPLDTSNYTKIFGRSLATYDTSTTNFGDFFMLFKSTTAVSGITIYNDSQIKAGQVKIYGLK